jgi:hypothetical protein
MKSSIVLANAFPAKRCLLALLIIDMAASPASAAPWSGILDPSRATDWSTVNWTIPNYTVPCPTQPVLLTGSGNDAANTALINAAIASCNGTTQNVVNIPSGTYYVKGFTFGGKNNVVVRGAGPNSTYLYLTPPASGCLGYNSVGVCMGGNALYYGNPSALPGGSNACSWTAGYSQGTASITLNSCGSAPPVGKIIVLDQSNDASDNGGVWVCDTYNYTYNGVQCSQKGTAPPTNADGRIIGGLVHSTQQETMITGVSGSGSGPYTVTISPALYFNNIRSGQSPGA